MRRDARAALTAENRPFRRQVLHGEFRSMAVPSPASPVAAEFRLMGIEGQIVR